MAKKGKKKDPEKKFALQAAKESKQNKKAQKRLQKESRRNAAAAGNEESGAAAGEDDDNLDALLEAYQKQNVDLATPLIEVLGAAENEGALLNNSSPFPYPPRGNFTLTVASSDVYMYGGEYFNGIENIVFEELLCWSPDAKSVDCTDVKDSNDSHSRGLWKRITSPQPRPPARCSHTTVFYNNALYVFGGELASADNYHHYRDLWRFDLKTNMWKELKPRNKGGPSSRSGHRALVWRHYMIIYGGFYEALREAPRWFNDLHVYDFSTNSWIECSYSKLATIPPERSAFNFGIALGSDVAFMSGGYSKLKNPEPGTKAEGLVHTDCWALHLKGLESGKNPTWERISRKGEYPSQRSGTACTMWKNKMLVFGGVDDEESENHKVKSVFYDDLFAFDTERKRWFRLNLKKKASERRRRRKVDDTVPTAIEEENNEDTSDSDEEEIEGEATSNGWDVDKLRSNMFAFIDGDGNIVFERIEEEDEDDDKDKDKEKDDDKEESTSTTVLDSGYEADSGGAASNCEDQNTKIKAESISSVGNEALAAMVAPGPAVTVPSIGRSEVMSLRDDGSPEAVSRTAPLPRIKAQIVVRGNSLILYGGILEVGDREVTLDDVWSLELQKREEWICIHEGSMHKQVWKGVASDDEKSYISTDAGTGGNESDDDDDDDFSEFYDIVDDNLLDTEAREAAKAAHKAAKKAAKKETKKGIREEVKLLNEKLTMDEPESAPRLGEELADFYARSTQYWGTKYIDSIASSTSNCEELSSKELKREGFNLAKQHFEELKPVLDRLAEIEISQKGDDDRKEKKAVKKDKKKKKDKRK
mmetsp:Transcript_18729/g.28449  ORF Transcript_18729/g.28449 Transcript_18729/m.28449 type:complete len:817 (+) Transcript_18729:106-2556(+)